VGRDTSIPGGTGATLERSPSYAELIPRSGDRPALAISPDLEDWPRPEPGRYVVAGEFARGGRGRILEAYDRRLDRTVALKELLSDDSQAKARFVREALVTARLQHPAIIPIFDVGRWASGKPFFAMKMLESGRSLAHAIHAAGGLDERLGLLPALVSVADAVAYAHQRGVLHRDLKPSNILLGPFGETMVIDWGLATELATAEAPRHIDSAYALAALPLTHTGSVMGTPLYMAPEQSKGKRLDERTDVYALGAILYHLLAGVPPYVEASPQDIMERLEQKPPVPLPEIEPRVPKELAAIVCKALSKDPADRYSTAQAFAEELKRFHTGQLVRAYQYPRRTLLRRWLVRHRAPVLVALAFAALFAITGAIALHRVIQEHKVAEVKNSDLIVFQARSLVEKDPTAAVAFLKSYRVLPDREHIVRDIALRAHAAGIAKHVFRRDEGAPSLAAFSSDSRLVATPRQGNKLQVVELDSGQVIAELPHRNDMDGRVQRLKFTADGTRILFSDWQGTSLYQWYFRTGELKRAGAPAPALVQHIFSTEGDWMAGMTGQATIWVRNVATSQLRELRGHSSQVESLVFGPGAQLLSASADGTARVWNVSTGTARVLEGRFPDLKVLAVPVAGTIAAADAGGTIHLWDASSGRYLASHPQFDRLNHLAFSPDGRRLAGAGESGTLRILDLATGATSSFAGHQGAIEIVALASGERVATGGLDGTVRIWNLQTGSHYVFRGHSAPVHWVQFSADEKYLSSSAADGTARVWRVRRDSEEVKVLRGHTDLAMHATFSSDGEKLATAGRDRLVRVWDLKSQTSIELQGHTDLVYRTDFSPDAGTLASAGFDGILRLWNISLQTSRKLRFHQGTIWAVKFSHRGNMVATSSADGIVGIWDARSGKLLKTRKELGPVYTVAFSPDDQLLAFAGSGGFGIWNLDSDQVSPYHSGEEVTQIAFSPDGQQFTWAGNANWLRVLDVATGKTRELRHPFGHLRAAAFSSDGRYVASADDINSIVLWDLVTNRSRSLRGHTAQITMVAFSPSSSVMASAARDKTVRLWDVSTGLPRAIYSDNGHVLNFAFSPGGEMIATVGSDISVKLWPIVPGPALSEASFYDDFRQWARSQTSAIFETDFAVENQQSQQRSGHEQATGGTATTVNQ
jgi:WD40 repeat protein/tRNA A-37 threonylcarbamoyl transferase component Bud32